MAKRWGWLVLLLLPAAAVLLLRPHRAVFAQEATRIPVLPTSSVDLRPVTRTPVPPATPPITPRPAPSPTPSPAPAALPTAALYLPLIGGEGIIFPSPTPGRIVLSVAGLAGTLERDSTGGKRLRVAGDRSLALLPATTTLDARLQALAASAPLEVVVTGTLYTTGRRDDSAFIVVTGIVEGPAPIEITPDFPGVGSPTSTATPVSGRAPMATGRFSLVNLRAGPGNEYTRVGVIRAGLRCEIVGRNGSSSWIRIECSDAAGWIETRLVFVEGSLPAAPVLDVAAPTPTATQSPTPSPTPTPLTFSGWRTLYFTNSSLEGLPAAVDDLPVLDLNWGTAQPRVDIPADGFSVRFERVVDFAPGFYLFTAAADDGIRLYIDDQLLLDQFGGASGQTFRFGRELGGQHALRVEYVEYSGAARVRFDWAAAPATRWAASYTNLPQTPGGFLQRMEPEGVPYPLDYNWGGGSPTGAPAANWTGRWEGRFTFAPGNYTFAALADDGVRLWLDNTLVLDKWTDGLGEVRNRFTNIGAGDHTVRVEYYQRGGDARVRAWWDREAPGLPMPQ